MLGKAGGVVHDGGKTHKGDIFHLTFEVPIYHSGIHFRHFQSRYDTLLRFPTPPLSLNPLAKRRTHCSRKTARGSADVSRKAKYSAKESGSLDPVNRTASPEVCRSTRTAPPLLHKEGLMDGIGVLHNVSHD
jgi:hypothetical protein